MVLNNTKMDTNQPEKKFHISVQDVLRTCGFTVEEIISCQVKQGHIWYVLFVSQIKHYPVWKLWNFVNEFSTLFHYCLPMEKCRALYLNKLNSLLHNDALCKVLFFGPVVIEEMIFYFVSVFLLIPHYLPLKKIWALHLNKL